MEMEKRRRWLGYLHLAVPPVPAETAPSSGTRPCARKEMGAHRKITAARAWRERDIRPNPRGGTGSGQNTMKWKSVDTNAGWRPLRRSAEDRCRRGRPHFQGGIVVLDINGRASTNSTASASPPSVMMFNELVQALCSAQMERESPEGSSDDDDRASQDRRKNRIIIAGEAAGNKPREPPRKWSADTRPL